MAIPQEILDEIQDKTNIVDLISSYIPLKRSGRNFKALCPFHSEKTPSFFVSPQRQIFHCFGCGIGGGPIQFLMRIEKISFLEAVEILAKKLGITLPKKTSPQDSLKTQAYSLNKEISSYFHNNLFKPQFKRILNYLKQRGLKEETIKKYKIGYAPKGFKNLIEHIRAKGGSLSLLDKLGTISPTPDGSYIDLFRDRIIFPIFDIKNRVIGFGGRRVEEREDLPKYINTPESILYHKGETLFGINFAKQAILKKDYCIIVEGYLDQIIPYQEGIENIVASLGTALTSEQIRMIGRYTKNIVVIFDSDSAGKLSSLRAIDLAIEQNLNVKLVKLPPGFDPDSFTREKGSQNFLKLIEEAEDFFFYKLELLSEKFNLENIQDKSKLLLEMLSTLSKFNNALLKYEYLKKLAERLKVKEEFLLIELRKIEKQDRKELSFKDNTFLKKELNFAEEYLLKSILHKPELLAIVRGVVQPHEFSHKTLRRIFEECLNFCEDSEDFSLKKLLTRVDEELASQISRLSLEEFNFDQETFKESLLKVKENSQKTKIEILKKKIKEAEEKKDYLQLKTLIPEYEKLVKERKLR